MRTFFLLSIGVLMLTSCSLGTGRDEPIVHSVAPEALTAEISLRAIRKDGGRTTLAIVVMNPKRVPIRSIRSWVRFDPSIVHAGDLTIEDGRFSLSAPGERTIDSEEGFVKIGVASKELVQDSIITLATFTVSSVTDEQPVVTFYDWRETGDGHTAVLTLQEGAVLNILNAPPSINL